jgi:hypothetical protein
MGEILHMMDWPHIRANKFSNERPDDWPKDIIEISVEGLSLFGIHKETDALYWDGKEIVVRRTIRLGRPELWFVGLAAVGTFGTFLVEVGRLGFWH